MARSSQPVRQFSVGPKDQGHDFSTEEIELLILKIRDWFQSAECDRQYDDPYAVAKQQVSECLLAENAQGEIWRNCPHDFAARIKIKCLYDIETGKGTKSKRHKNPLAQRALSKEAQKSVSTIYAFQPPPDFDVAAFRDDKEKAILITYPELDNDAHRPIVRRLSLLYSEQHVIDLELTTSKKITHKRRETIVKMLDSIGKQVSETLNILGIHPNQIKQNLKQRSQGSISELVDMLAQDDEFKERTKLWSLQLALQLWWMTQHPNGRGDGPQLEEWEMWTMTRTRPIKFKCEHGVEYTLVEGFTPDELKEYLLRHGVLLEKPVLPQFIDSEDVSGLAPDRRNKLDHLVRELEDA